MSDMVTYFEQEEITAFTTTRRYGRDASILCLALKVPAERFYRPHQVHKTDVLVLHQEDTTFPVLSPDGTLGDYDAVIYDVRNACIGISTADCIPVLCYDPAHHCAAAIHAGWRGTVARIVEHAIDRLQQEFSSNPSQLLCAVGPGISLDSFEVGDEVYDAFRDAGFGMNSMSVRYPNGKWHLDLKACNASQLMAMGVKPENITVSPLDTMTDTRFYSARREGAATGRMLSGILLK